MLCTQGAGRKAQSKAGADRWLSLPVSLSLCPSAAKGTVPCFPPAADTEAVQGTSLQAKQMQMCCCKWLWRPGPVTLDSRVRASCWPLWNPEFMGSLSLINVKECIFSSPGIGECVSEGSILSTAHSCLAPVFILEP